jgi:hypothetical protein
MVVLVEAPIPSVILLPLPVPVTEKVTFPCSMKILKLTPTDRPFRVQVIVDFPEIFTTNILPLSASVGVQLEVLLSNTAEVRCGSLGMRIGEEKVPPAALIPFVKL